MDIMTHAKFHFNRLMLTLISGIWASEPPPLAWRTTEKARPDRVKPAFDFLDNWAIEHKEIKIDVLFFILSWELKASGDKLWAK